MCVCVCVSLSPSLSFSLPLCSLLFILSVSTQLSGMRTQCILAFYIHTSNRLLFFFIVSKNKTHTEFIMDRIFLGNPHAFDSDAYWEHFIRYFALTGYHPVGTCKMGASLDNQSVVSPRLVVRGVRRLRVADASVLPSVISGNTHALCVMIGERAADFILRERALEEDTCIGDKFIEDIEDKFIEDIGDKLIEDRIGDHDHFDGVEI